MEWVEHDTELDDIRECYVLRPMEEYATHGDYSIAVYQDKASTCWRILDQHTGDVSGATGSFATKEDAMAVAVAFARMS